MNSKKIHFFSEDTKYVTAQKNIVRQWLNDVVENEDKSLENVNIILCSDDYLLQVNQEYLQHDYYTDIITFEYNPEPYLILGDLFISIDRVKENARLNQCKISDELHRIFVHGVLHLMGYNDKESSEKQLMTEKEDFYLLKLSKIIDEQ